MESPRLQFHSLLICAVLSLLLLSDNASAQNSTYCASPVVAIVPPSSNAKLTLMTACLTLDPSLGLFYLNATNTYQVQGSPVIALPAVLMNGNWFIDQNAHMLFSFANTSTTYCSQTALSSPNLCPLYETLVDGPFEFGAFPYNGSNEQSLTIQASTLVFNPQTNAPMIFLGASKPITFTCQGTCAALNVLVPPAPFPVNGSSSFKNLNVTGRLGLSTDTASECFGAAQDVCISHCGGPGKLCVTPNAGPNLGSLIISINQGAGGDGVAFTANGGNVKLGKQFSVGINPGDTEGYPYVPGIGGVPTGVPTDASSQNAPYGVDTTNHLWDFYSGGWQTALSGVYDAITNTITTLQNLIVPAITAQTIDVQSETVECWISVGGGTPVNVNCGDLTANRGLFGNQAPITQVDPFTSAYVSDIGAITNTSGNLRGVQINKHGILLNSPTSTMTLYGLDINFILDAASVTPNSFVAIRGLNSIATLDIGTANAVNLIGAMSSCAITNTSFSGTVTTSKGYSASLRLPSGGNGTITTHADYWPGAASVSGATIALTNHYKFYCSGSTVNYGTNRACFRGDVVSGGTNNAVFQFADTTGVTGGGMAFGSFEFFVYRSTANLLALSGTASLTMAGDITARHHLCQAGTPTIACGTGAQGAGTGTCTVTGTDCGGSITVVTAGVPAASSTVVTLTFNTAYPNNVDATTLTPFGSATAQALSGTQQIGVGTQATTTFTIKSGTVGLVTGTTYIWNYSIRGS